VRRPGTNALTVELALDLNGGSGHVTGRVFTAQWDAALLGDHDVFDARTSRAPFATNYTLAVRGDSQAELRPGGDGFGTARVDAGGTVSFAGTLADGSKVTQKTAVSRNGNWPFYLALYGGKGSMLGWLTFGDGPTNDLGGKLSWIRPPSITSALYPAGFAFDTEVDGSVYTRPGTGRVLDLTNAVVVFTGGNLSAPITNPVMLGPDNKVTNEGSNRLVLTVVTPLGLIHGAVTPPEGANSLPFRGVLLQKQRSGAGFFLGTSQSGRLLLQARQP